MLLLDTHLVLWTAFDPARLSPKAARLIRARDTPLAFSLATLWELAIKTSLGRPEFVVDVKKLRQGLMDESFVELPIRAEHLFRVVTLPWIHRDPFDRLLVAQALEDKITLLTSDRTLLGYGRAVRAV